MCVICKWNRTLVKQITFQTKSSALAFAARSFNVAEIYQHVSTTFQHPIGDAHATGCPRVSCQTKSMSSGITSSSWSMDATWQCLGYWISDIEKSWKTQDHHHHDHLILHLILVIIILLCLLVVLPIHLLHHLSHLYFHQPRTKSLCEISYQPQTPKPNPKLELSPTDHLISCSFPPPAPVARSPSMTGHATQWCTPLSQQSGTKNLSFNWKKWATLGLEDVEKQSQLVSMRFVESQ